MYRVNNESPQDTLSLVHICSGHMLPLDNFNLPLYNTQEIFLGTVGIARDLNRGPQDLQPGAIPLSHHTCHWATTSTTEPPQLPLSHHRVNNEPFIGCPLFSNKSKNEWSEIAKKRVSFACFALKRNGIFWMRNKMIWSEKYRKYQNIVLKIPKTVNIFYRTDLKKQPDIHGCLDEAKTKEINY